MIDWLINNSIIAGIVTVILMWCDWLLSLAQEKERRMHYYEHYESYPINTIEGNPFLRNDVQKFKLVNIKHISIALGLGTFIAVFLNKIPIELSRFFLGFFWGLFLVVNTQHISNLISYRVSRKGIHGKIYMHLRTGYYIQFGRYLAIAIFLIILSILSGELVLYGVTNAAFISAFRMLIWLKKVPRIDMNDLPPENVIIKNE